MNAPPPIACPECDLPQRDPGLRAGALHCARCGAVLYRAHPRGPERAFALSIASAILLAIAVSYPIMGLEVQATTIQTSVIGAVRALWNEDMEAVAALVLVTTVLVPAIEVGSMILLLLPLQFGRVGASSRRLLRVLGAVRPWGMVEVLLLGVLVAVAKLAETATVLPGVALYCAGALVVLLAATASAFGRHDVWLRFESPR